MLVQVRKGSQITIPSKIRKAMGIKEGDMLEVELQDKQLMLKPAKRKEVELKLVPAKELRNLVGIVSIGGDAVKDTEDLYNE